MLMDQRIIKPFFHTLTALDVVHQAALSPLNAGDCVPQLQIQVGNFSHQQIVHLRRYLATLAADSMQDVCATYLATLDTDTTQVMHLRRYLEIKLNRNK